LGTAKGIALLHSASWLASLTLHSPPLLLLLLLLLLLGSPTQLQQPAFDQLAIGQGTGGLGRHMQL
jgi:hypothetical protein